MDKNIRESDDVVDSSLFNAKSLAVLNIQDLRDLGRTLGVPSPTTKSKQELIDYTLNIIYGEVEASERTSCGRPNLRDFDLNKVVTKLKRNVVLTPEDLKQELSGEGSLQFKLASPLNDYVVCEEIVQRIYVEEDGKSLLKVHGFVGSPNDIEIPSEIAKKHKLENFDVLEVMTNGDLFKIVSINGVKTENKFNGIKINGKQVDEGSKQVFHLSTKEEIRNEILKIEKSCAENNLKVLIFSSDKFDGETTQLVSYDEDDNGSLVYKKLMCFVDMCEKSLYETDQIVVVVDKTTAIENALDSFENDIADRIKKHLQEQISKLSSLGNVLVVYKLDQVVSY